MQAAQKLKAAATAGLGAFYVGLAITAANPNVSQEWRDHYLERRVDCWLSDVQRAVGPGLPRSIGLGGMAYRQSCMFLRAGWLVPHPDVAWSRPGTATLRIPWRPDATGVRLDLRGPPGPGPIGVTLRLGEEQAELEVPPEEERTVVLTLPPSRRSWEITVRSDGKGTVTRPGPVPTQLVGIGLDRITYLPE